jgi:hypothetical protein
MNIIKKLVHVLILTGIIVNCTSNAFLGTIYWSHHMSALSVYKQQHSYLLDDMRHEADAITTILSKRNEEQARTYLTEKNNNHFELTFSINHCFDIDLKDHAIDKDELIAQLTTLITTFNALVAPISLAQVAHTSDEQIQEVIAANKALTGFCTKYGFASADTRATLRTLQQQARENNPAQSIIRKEYVLPVSAITALIVGIVMWKKGWFAQLWSWITSPATPEHSSLSLSTPVIIGDQTVQGNESVINDKTRLVQVRVARQANADCGYNATYNAVSLLEALQGNESAQDHLLDTDNTFNTMILPQLQKESIEFVSGRLRSEENNLREFLQGAGTKSYNNSLERYKVRKKIASSGSLTQTQQDEFIRSEIDQLRATYHSRENDDISGSIIEMLIKKIPANLQDQITVIDDIRHLGLLNNVQQKLITEPSYVHAFILGSMQQKADTSGTGGHWIAVVAHKKADGSRTFVIADSMNFNQLTSPLVRQLVGALEIQLITQ